MRSSADENAKRPLLLLARKVDADRLLQSEIDVAMQSLMGALPTVTVMRVAGVLGAVLAPSWSEHRHFQEEVLFPVVFRARGRDGEFAEFVGRMGDEHSEIGEHQRELSVNLKQLANGSLVLGAGLRDLIEQTVALRRQHHAAENTFDLKIPSASMTHRAQSSSAGSTGRGRIRFPST